jgi:hypothetical protein
MRVDGQCHCGQVRYEAHVDADKVSICHCTDCQSLTGSAYRVFVPVAAADFKLLSGPPKTYIKTAESGNKRAQAFCGNCGSPIYAADPVNPKIFSVRVGTLTQRDALPPKRQIWCRSALPWSAHIQSLDRSERA